MTWVVVIVMCLQMHKFAHNSFVTVCSDSDDRFMDMLFLYSGLFFKLEVSNITQKPSQCGKLLFAPTYVKRVNLTPFLVEARSETAFNNLLCC